MEKQAIDIVRKKYPNAVELVVASLGISHVYYENNTYTNKVAETRYLNHPNHGYTNKQKLVWLVNKSRK